MTPTPTSAGSGASPSDSSASDRSDRSDRSDPQRSRPDRAASERPTDRRAYRVTGGVQGVGYRWFTRQVAVELGLSGTVRNARDGSVEVEAAGAPERLDAFESKLRSGPAMARVAGVDRMPSSGGSLPAGFEIRR